MYIRVQVVWCERLECLAWEGVCVSESAQSEVREGQNCRGTIRYSTVSARQRRLDQPNCQAPYPLQVVGTLRTFFARPLPLPSQRQPGQTGNKRAKAKWLDPAASLEWRGHRPADTVWPHGHRLCRLVNSEKETCIGRLRCALGVLVRGAASDCLAGIT
ncbi:hypothetical protein LZ30DRAFT_215169 [Colletotrichum cereale]|nr:hypothetical protein LZ30DRAFT_215169 [Colletotrichum cereale]